MRQRHFVRKVAICCCLALFVVRSAGANENVHRRGDLGNSRLQFELHKKGHVAFMGGSITEMDGYRPLVCRALEKRFPDTAFTFTDAGISSTCSTTGAFRLGDDVLAKGPVDLFFVEFAVNDDGDGGHARRECIRGMEGIVRQVRRHNPMADIIMTYFVHPGMLETIQAGRTPRTVEAHRAVAEHYGISTIDLAKEVADQIGRDELTWKEFGGTHPAPRGNAICASMIDGLLAVAWQGAVPPGVARTAYPHPRPLDEQSYSFGRFVSIRMAKGDDGWRIEVPDWSELPGRKRDRFTRVDLLCAGKPDATLQLEFQGTVVGAYVLAGPEAGIVEATVDGGASRSIDLYHRHSRNLHYPRTVLFATDLAPGKHTLQLSVSKRSGSAGHAVRILQFVANSVPAG